MEARGKVRKEEWKKNSRWIEMKRDINKQSDLSDEDVREQEVIE